MILDTRHVAFFCIAALAVWLFISADRYAKQHITIKNIVVNSDDVYLKHTADKMLAKYRHRPMLSVSLEELVAELKRLPGISEAVVGRQLNTQQLSVQVFAHQPLAQWHEGGMVDIYGHIYPAVADRRLAIFSAPSSQVTKVTEFYDIATQLLGKDAIAQVDLSAQEEWKLFLKNGVILRLGASQPLGKLRRYQRHADKLHRRFGNLKVVDLRYDKGLAIIPQNNAQPNNPNNFDNPNQQRRTTQ